jgi:hypothetical protein
VNLKVILATGLVAGVASAHAFQYRTDSGVSQNSIGLTNGGEVAWMQTFTVTGGNSVITAIELAFGTTAGSGVTAGTAFDVYVWRGTPTGAGADAPTLLATASSTVGAGIPDTDAFQSVAVNASITGTNNFFIGASMNHAAGVFPASIQQTDPGGWPILANSWTAGHASANGFDPNNLTGGIGLFQNSTIGLGGNYLLRAQAQVVPEPATMSALAAALGALALRRRKRSL